MKNDEYKFAWPDVPRICFGPGQPRKLNACVGWVQSRPHDMHGYVEGYRQAATVLVEHAEELQASPDYLVFPFAFMWRQHIELALKQIIAVGRELNNEPCGFPDGHKLVNLWNTAKPFVLQTGDPRAPEIATVEANIKEFERIDPYADGFRYPLDRGQAGPSLPNVPDLVNLRVLQDAMEALANFLSAVTSELRRRIEWQIEMLANTPHE